MSKSPEQFVAALWSSLLPGWTADEAKSRADAAFGAWRREIAGDKRKLAQGMEELERVILREQSAVARPHPDDPIQQVLQHLRELARQALDEAKHKG